MEVIKLQQTAYQGIKNSTVFHAKSSDRIQELFGVQADVYFVCLSNVVQSRCNFEGVSKQSISIKKQGLEVFENQPNFILISTEILYT